MQLLPEGWDYHGMTVEIANYRKSGILGSNHVRVLQATTRGEYHHRYHHLVLGSARRQTICPCTASSSVNSADFECRRDHNSLDSFFASFQRFQGCLSFSCYLVSFDRNNNNVNIDTIRIVAPSVTKRVIAYLCSSSGRS